MKQVIKPIKKNIPSTSRDKNEIITTPKLRKDNGVLKTNHAFSQISDISINANNTSKNEIINRPNENKLSINDLKSPIDNAQYTNQSDSIPRLSDKKENDDDHIRILSNTNLFSNTNPNNQSEDTIVNLIDKLSKSDLKTNPDFMNQLTKLISQHSASSIKDNLIENSNNKSLNINENSNNSYELTDLKIERAQQRVCDKIDHMYTTQIESKDNIKSNNLNDKYSNCINNSDKIDHHLELNENSPKIIKVGSPQNLKTNNENANANNKNKIYGNSKNIQRD